MYLHHLTKPETRVANLFIYTGSAIASEERDLQIHIPLVLNALLNISDKSRRSQFAHVEVCINYKPRKSLDIHFIYTINHYNNI